MLQAAGETSTDNRQVRNDCGVSLMKYKFFKITAIITIIANILVLGMLLYVENFVLKDVFNQEFYIQHDDYTVSNSVFESTIDDFCDKFNFPFDDILFLAFIYAVIIRLIDYIALLIFYREQNKYTNNQYSTKLKVINFIGILALPFWCILLSYFPYKYLFPRNPLQGEYLFMDPLDYFILTIIIAVGTIIMDIMGLCYKSQEK